MENLTHTLFGLCMAKTGLEMATPLAATTLVVSSNLPDIDLLGTVTGGSYIELHRGFTHSFIGLAVLAVGLTLVLFLSDRFVRLRGDPFRRPIKPFQIFFLAYLGGLGHLFMDFTNAYGVRPLLPFIGHWFHGDLVFVADPWIWLILGSACFWMTTQPAPGNPRRTGLGVLWLIIALGASYPIVMGIVRPGPFQDQLPLAIGIVWAVGLLAIVIGRGMELGRKGPLIAKTSLVVLALYYGGMWIGHQTAIKQATISLKKVQKIDVDSLSAWPTAANPLKWQTAAANSEHILTGYVSLIGGAVLKSPDGPLGWKDDAPLESQYVDALRTSPDASIFLDFARYPTGTVQETESGYKITMKDARFNLHMEADMTKDMTVDSVRVSWF